VTLAPVVEQVAAELAGKFKIVAANVDEAGESAGAAGIMSIPALVFYKAGKEVHRIVGHVKKDKLIEEIRKHLGE
jgi:thioredoxin 1